VRIALEQRDRRRSAPHFERLITDDLDGNCCARLRMGRAEIMIRPRDGIRIAPFLKYLIHQSLERRALNRPTDLEKRWSKRKGYPNPRAGALDL